MLTLEGKMTDSEFSDRWWVDRRIPFEGDEDDISIAGKTLHRGRGRYMSTTRGYHNQCLSFDIRPLADTMKVAGPAYTVLGRPRYHDDGIDPRCKQMDMLDAIPSGTVNLAKRDQRLIGGN